MGESAPPSVGSTGPFTPEDNMGILERIEAKVDQILVRQGEDVFPPIPPIDEPVDDGLEPDPTWLHKDVSDWPVTSQISEVLFTAKTLTVKHSAAGTWKTITLPSRAVVEGNPWVMAMVAGELFAGTYEWLRPGQSKKNITASNIGAHIKTEPLASWRPVNGEHVYFMVSALARESDAARRGSQERSNIVLVRWGTNWKA